MFHRGNITLLLLLMLIFVGFGDSFLPKPLSTASYQTRTTINNFVIGMFPAWRLKTNPHQKTQEAINETSK
ncbi:MAG: hypothetical protein IGS39_25320 [Calothrix sp. C42_A2020_038]|nr:hypothetical protein [Calothrix sp. C42_A2020_038]